MTMNEKKLYEAGEFAFEFTPHGDPLNGYLKVTHTEFEGYAADVVLNKAGSRNRYAKDASELYGFEKGKLKHALNELCDLRHTEVEFAKIAAENRDVGQVQDEPLSEEAETIVATPGVLGRYAEDVAKMRGVVGDRDVLLLQCLVAFGAQLAPLPSGRPAGANLMLTAEAGRGKNYICDAIATALPDEFYLSFESASAKSLYYRAESDPTIFRHRWLYPNEAEGTDQLVETLRPVMSGGKAAHLTVNKTPAGHNSSQELIIEGPISITIPTVRNKPDGQLQSRMLVAEIEDYEGRVAQHSRAVSRQLLPNRAGEDHSPLINAWKAALKSLTTIRRVVFLLEHNGFCLDSDTVSHGARLWANVLGLMMANAWLEQRNRQIIELADGERAVVATAEDYEVAYAVFKATCARSVVNLSTTHRAILNAVYDLSCQNGSEGFSLRAIAEFAGVHHSTVSDHKTYLMKSVKLLREIDGKGLGLVEGAEPAWWSGDDVLIGFPRPEQVRLWFEEGVSETPH